MFGAGILCIIIGGITQKDMIDGFVYLGRYESKVLHIVKL